MHNNGDCVRGFFLLSFKCCVRACIDITCICGGMHDGNGYGWMLKIVILWPFDFVVVEWVNDGGGENKHHLHLMSYV